MGPAQPEPAGKGRSHRLLLLPGLLRISGKPLQQRGEGLGGTACALLRRKRSVIMVGSTPTPPARSPSRGQSALPPPGQPLCRDGGSLPHPVLPCAARTRRAPTDHLHHLQPRRGAAASSAYCSYANPFIGKTTRSRAAAAVTFPALPRVPHLLSKLRKYPVRLSWNRSAAFRSG